MGNNKSGVVFGRSWLGGHSDPLVGFELGRLGMACLATEYITLHTHSFFEVPYIIKQVGKKAFLQEVRNGRIDFVCQIENIAVCNLSGDKERSTGTMIFPPELVDLRDKGDIKVLKKQLAGNDLDLSDEEVELIYNSTTFTPMTMNQDIMTALVQDILDVKLRTVLNHFFQDWFNTKEDALSFLRVKGSSTIVFDEVPLSSIDFSNSNLQSMFFMLHTAYSQAAILNLVDNSDIFSDLAIYDLQMRISQAKGGEALGKIEEIVATTSSSIDLPNISWLVSKEILPISKLVSFKNSKKGEKFRCFLKSFSDKDEDLKNEIQKFLIKSLHGKTKWEEAWESGVAKVVRISVATGLGLFPEAGPLLGVGASAIDATVDNTIPRNYKPTAILDNVVSNNTDAEKIAKEKESGTNLPSLTKLEEQGYRPSFYLINKLKTQTWIFLDKPGSPEHWQLKLDFEAQPSSKSYFNDFLSKLSHYSEDINQFLSLLKDGATINTKSTKFRRNPETGETNLTLEYKIDGESGLITFSSDERDFWDFVTGRNYFDNPNAYNEKISEPCRDLNLC